MVQTEISKDELDRSEAATSETEVTISETVAESACDRSPLSPSTQSEFEDSARARSFEAFEKSAAKFAAFTKAFNDWIGALTRIGWLLLGLYFVSGLHGKLTRSADPIITKYPLLILGISIFAITLVFSIVFFINTFITLIKPTINVANKHRILLFPFAVYYFFLAFLMFSTWFAAIAVTLYAWDEHTVSCINDRFSVECASALEPVWPPLKQIISGIFLITREFNSYF
ncbi:hypothetical protein ACC708_12445 [Rhizobium ruizarguesonis]